jgi:hypothetical protein
MWYSRSNRLSSTQTGWPRSSGSCRTFCRYRGTRGSRPRTASTKSAWLGGGPSTTATEAIASDACRSSSSASRNAASRGVRCSIAGLQRTATPGYRRGKAHPSARLTTQPGPLAPSVRAEIPPRRTTPDGGSHSVVPALRPYPCRTRWSRRARSRAGTPARQRGAQGRAGRHAGLGDLAADLRADSASHRPGPSALSPGTSVAIDPGPPASGGAVVGSFASGAGCRRDRGCG